MKPEWVRDLRDQCEGAGANFFFKQWGGVRKSETGRLLDGRTYDDMPEQMRNAVPARPQRNTMIERVERDAGVKRVELVPLRTPNE